MAKGKKGGFNKKAARLRAAATVTAATAASAARKSKNKYSNQQHRDREPSIGFGSLGQRPEGTGMQELARNTRNRTAHWDQDSKLRDRPVAFVSGGFIEPADELESEPPVSSSHIPPSPPAIDPSILPAHTSANPNPTFGAQNLSDGDSDSSAEVILFKGRNCHKPTQPATRDKATPNASNPTVGQRYLSALPDNRDNPRHSNSLDHLIVASDDESGSAAAIDDYIANLLLVDVEDAGKQMQTKSSKLGGSDCEFVFDACERSDASRAKEGPQSGTYDGTNSANDNNGDNTEDDLDEGSDDLDEADELAAHTKDEQLARLFAKQEELGFESAELLLRDGDLANLLGSRKRDGRPDSPAKGGRRSTSSKQKASPIRALAKGLKPRDGSYPSAEAVADAFEQLDVTGWNNGHHGFELGLSDSDLETTLLASWLKDSQRKRDRKKAREELRSHGLLGKNADANDTRVKYPRGMSLDEIRSEFQGFLLGTEHSLTLPPMDARARKIIHELAHRFGVTSKSTGSGDQRRPTLVRKKGTPVFDASHFNGVFARVGRRYFARLDVKQTGPGGLQKPHGENSAAVIVRNGEIVGGSAPEIGLENKGRTMLERMGWSVGMALGALNNKGMTQPIEHVVKRSKAGLG